MATVVTVKVHHPHDDCSEDGSCPSRLVGEAADAAKSLAGYGKVLSGYTGIQGLTDAVKKITGE